MLARLAAAPILLAALPLLGHAQTAAATRSDQSAAQSQTMSASSRKLREQMETIRQAIAREVGAAAADDASQCAVIAFGAKACGGPQSYIVYSRLAANEKRIMSLAARYARLERKWNRANKIISTCDIPRRPVPVIVDGRCQANTNGTAPAE